MMVTPKIIRKKFNSPIQQRWVESSWFFGLLHLAVCNTRHEWQPHLETIWSNVPCKKIEIISEPPCRKKSGRLTHLSLFSLCSNKSSEPPASDLIEAACDLKERTLKDKPEAAVASEPLADDKGLLGTRGGKGGGWWSATVNDDDVKSCRQAELH